VGEYNGVVGGVSSIVTDGFKPWWQGMQNTVDANLQDETLTVREAYENALNFTFEAKPVYVEHTIDGASQFLPVEGKVAQVKSDDGTVVGITSDTFGQTQPEVLCEFLEALKAASGGTVLCKSAGSLFGFRQTWMLAKLGEDRYFGDQSERIERYLLAATGHDGSLALSARPTNVRVECMNTFDWAIKGTRSLVTLRHTSGVADRIETAKKVITEAYEHYSALDVEIEQLLATPYSRTQYQDILVPALVGPKPSDEGSERSQTLWEKKRDGLVASYERPDQRNIAGTGWGAVMAVNSFENWGQTVRGQSRAESQARRAVKGDFSLTAQARELVTA
jgi:phage/plasmid-like protein (TIGR03299 family)